tara:strand:- start:2598 stop:2858 length:261 start_codon:yes stop_codon:yes gene_type:complete
MTLYNKVNKFLGKHSYLPDTMYGDNNKCIIKYDLINKEYSGMYKKLSGVIKNKPNFWNNADIKFAIIIDEPSIKITITANSWGKIV